jgi:hypothetical protein
MASVLTVYVFAGCPMFAILFASMFSPFQLSGDGLFGALGE